MLNRILISIISIPLLIYIFLFGNISFLLFTEVVILLSVYELYTMFEKKGKKVYKIAGLLISSIIPLVVFHNKIDYIIVVVVSLLILSIIQVCRISIIDATEKLSLTYFGIMYISFLFSYIIKIKKMPNGGAIVLFCFLLIWACDSFAYFSGIAFGRHKFTEISPSKSIEGLIGGFVGVLVTTIFYNKIYFYLIKAIEYTKILKVDNKTVNIFPNINKELVIFSLLITAIAVFGDLFESKLKREFSIKDSSNLLLGHGGFLDRFDSSLFVIPVVYIISSIFVGV